MEIFVYIVECVDGSYYTGLTRREIASRIWEHNNLPNDKSYTGKRRPVKLVFAEAYDRIDEAIQRERQIKGWSRKKKQALITLSYETLPAISRRSHLI